MASAGQQLGDVTHRCKASVSGSPAVKPGGLTAGAGCAGGGTDAMPGSGHN